MKRMLAAFALVVLGMLLCTPALADKVSYIEKGGDVADHLAHLAGHDADTVYTCTGDHVKLSITPNSLRICGRMMTGERFTIIDRYKDWLRIEIVSATPDNDDSRRGMVGWITAEYIDCGCDEAAYCAEPAEPDEQAN